MVRMEWKGSVEPAKAVKVKTGKQPAVKVRAADPAVVKINAGKKTG